MHSSPSGVGGFKFRYLVLGFLPLLLFGVAACNNTTTTNATTNPTPTPTPQPQIAKKLAVWTNSFVGASFTMVGTDPMIPGSGTTSIPAEIIPVVFTFTPANMVLSPTGPACGDNVPMVQRVTNSPLFTTDITWGDSGVIIGTTQFPDAFQRANFWSIVSTASPNYHVLLQPVSVLPTVTVEVPLNSTVQPNPSPVCSQPYIGVTTSFMDSVVQNAVAQLQITADTLPIFLTYDALFLPGGGVEWLGYHFVQGNQTYVVASYTDPTFNLFNYQASDITILSHELGEWMDNPLLVNNLPFPWGRIGIQQLCGPNLEVGDPLSDRIYPMPTATFTYHFQELAYFSWFARNNPSLAINNRYSTQGTLTGPAPPCI